MFEAGQGFYGAVYKGMWNNAEVAVKKIFPSKIQSMSKWLTEVEFLRCVRFARTPLHTLMHAHTHTLRLILQYSAPPEHCGVLWCMHHAPGYLHRH